MDIFLPPVRLSAPPVAVVPSGPAPVAAKEVITPLAIFAVIGLGLWWLAGRDAEEEATRLKNPVRGIQTREDFQRYLES